jgi:hypothetical protein
MADKTVRYTPEFRRLKAELVRSGRTAGSLSKEFGLTAWSIALWVKRAARDAGNGDAGPATAQRAAPHSRGHDERAPLRRRLRAPPPWWQQTEQRFDRERVWSIVIPDRHPGIGDTTAQASTNARPETSDVGPIARP